MEKRKIVSRLKMSTQPMQTNRCAHVRSFYGWHSLSLPLSHWKIGGKPSAIISRTRFKSISSLEISFDFFSANAHRAFVDSINKSIYFDVCLLISRIHFHFFSHISVELGRFDSFRLEIVCAKRCKMNDGPSQIGNVDWQRCGIHHTATATIEPQFAGIHINVAAFGRHHSNKITTKYTRLMCALRIVDVLL